MPNSSLLQDDMDEHDFSEVRSFSQTDYEILKSYEAVVDGLAMLIGPHCEVVLHSLDDFNCSAIRIANGIHTGRKVGAPITDSALRMLHEISKDPRQVSKSYFTRTKHGTLMKSATIVIRNRQQKNIGLLCININLDVPFSQLIQTFMLPDQQEIPSSDSFSSSVEDLVTKALEFTIEEVSTDRTVSNNLKNKQIVLSLYEKGIFDIKDAINQVAERLNISKHTVYLYIRQFKHDESDGEK